MVNYYFQISFYFNRCILYAYVYSELPVKMLDQEQTTSQLKKNLDRLETSSVWYQNM